MDWRAKKRSGRRGTTGQPLVPRNEEGRITQQAENKAKKAGSANFRAEKDAVRLDL